MKIIASLLLLVASLGNLHGGIIESVAQAILADKSDIVIVSRISATDIVLSGNREVSFPDLLKEIEKTKGNAAVLLYDVNQSVKGHLDGIAFFIQGGERIRNPHTGIHGFLPDEGTVWIAVVSKNEVQNVNGATAATFLDTIGAVSKVTDGKINGEVAEDIINDLKIIATHLDKGEGFVLKTQFAQSVADHLLQTTGTENSIH